MKVILCDGAEWLVDKVDFLEDFVCEVNVINWGKRQIPVASIKQIVPLSQQINIS